MNVFMGLMLPFIGTAAGSACVFFMKDQIKPQVQKALLGFAAGVMVAASVWSLLIPSMDMSDHLGKLAFLPAAGGFLLGIFFLLFLDDVIPHLHLGSKEPEGPKSHLKKTTMLMLAVTIHNFPEGAATGAAFAGVLTGHGEITMAGAVTLALGIAIQNFPEGAIISMPLKSEGSSKAKAFFAGAMSGIVEPISAAAAILLASVVDPILPVLLSFAAGAMIYVVVEELIPEASEGKHSNIGTIGFSIGFAVMMILDVALG